MNFLPQFLNATTAAVAAAIAVPLLLLLYFLKLRRQPVPIGSTLLWKKAIQDLQVNSPFQRLRRNLLLLLQLLILLALIFALARPVSEGTAVAGDKNVIIIDRSASMNAEDGDGGTRLDEAKARAKALINTMRRGSQAMIIAFADDTGTGIVQPFTGDTAALKSAIDNVTASDRPTRLKTAYTLANANMQVDYLAAEAAGEAVQQVPVDVFLFSDGRVPESDIRELSLRGKLNYEKVGKADTQNIAVVAASAKRNYERPTEVQVFARLANFGPAPAEAQVRISVAEIPEDGSAELDFKPATIQPISANIPPARWGDPAWRTANEADANEADQAMQSFKRIDSIDVRMELGAAAVILVELLNNDDALPSDDVAWIVVPPPEPLKALLVTEGNYFLEKLVQSLQLQDAKNISPAEYERTLPTDYDIVLFDVYSPQKLPPAGTFVFSGGLPPADATKVTQVTSDDDFGMHYTDSEVLDWQRDHPMLVGLNLNNIYIAEGRLLTVPLGAEMLIEGVKGPLLILERSGPRVHLIFSFDLLQSNWQLRKTWPIFGYQMFQYLAAGEDVRVRESVRPGVVVNVPRAVVDRARVEGSVSLYGPDARRSIPVDQNGSITLDSLERVGVYATDPSLPQFERVAVSLLDDNESNLLPNPTDPGNLSGIEIASGPQAEEDAGVRNLEWWWWLVAVAAAILLLEWAVYTRRVAA